jgi:flagellar hook-length control protein FliK
LDIIEQISSKLQLKNGETVNEVKIKLTPEALGDLMIKITMERGIVNARAIVENPVVKQIIESNLFELKENLKSQGINFDKFEVLVGEDSKEQNHSQQNMHWKDPNDRKKRNFAEIDDLELEELGDLLDQSIINSERLDTII